MGVKAPATLPTREVIHSPKAFAVLLSRLTSNGSFLKPQGQGIEKLEKGRLKLARLYAYIANIRQDALHKFTSDLTRRFSTIVLEDLNVCGMMRNHHLARAISGMGFREFRRQIEYKASMRGCEVIFADRFYPSSKTCSVCGYVLDVLPLSVRKWMCPDCGSHHDRDFNAAVNLKNLAASSAASAGGEESSGFWS
jgi:putative transposase